jgi:hypothetical protein
MILLMDYEELPAKSEIGLELEELAEVAKGRTDARLRQNARAPRHRCGGPLPKLG